MIEPGRGWQAAHQRQRQLQSPRPRPAARGAAPPGRGRATCCRWCAAICRAVARPGVCGASCVELQQQAFADRARADARPGRASARCPARSPVRRSVALGLGPQRRGDVVERVGEVAVVVDRIDDARAPMASSRADGLRQLQLPQQVIAQASCRASSANSCWRSSSLGAPGVLGRADALVVPASRRRPRPAVSAGRAPAGLAAHLGAAAPATRSCSVASPSSSCSSMTLLSSSSRMCACSSSVGNCSRRMACCSCGVMVSCCPRRSCSEALSMGSGVSGRNRSAVVVSCRLSTNCSKCKGLAQVHLTDALVGKDLLPQCRRRSQYPDRRCRRGRRRSAFRGHYGR